VKLRAKIMRLHGGHLDFSDAAPGLPVRMVE